jgi:hypothetical protein
MGIFFIHSMSDEVFEHFFFQNRHGPPGESPWTTGGLETTV